MELEKIYEQIHKISDGSVGCNDAELDSLRCNLSQYLQRDEMRWSLEVPTDAGFWWVRIHLPDKLVDRIIEIRQTEDGLLVWAWLASPMRLEYFLERHRKYLVEYCRIFKPAGGACEK